VNDTQVYGTIPNINASTASIQEQIDYFSAPGYCNNIDPEYLAYINTPVLARDLELVRNLSGIEALNYIGWEDGSVVGVTYAALFPEHVGYMVFDCI
jgi:pimeloyl-ACP methyl ester carboxylesterase